METLAQVIIFTPIFVPLLEKLSIDPIHFGVLFILCCEVGFLTPPLGANLYIATKISNVPIEHIFVAILPFIITLILAILSIIFIPQISLILPALLMR
jgi:C4-dicarboxylate transporter DctM subunit